MNLSTEELDILLPGYFSEDLQDEDLKTVNQWREASPENEAHYRDSLKAWESISLLKEMEQFNSFEALRRVNERIEVPFSYKFLNFLKLTAAVLALPLLAYSGYVTYHNSNLKKMIADRVIMQTVTSRQGMVSQFQLADGTKVWLNSNSELQFPSIFAGDFREVKLKGEAYFEVFKNKNQPFRVAADEFSVEVLGTSFDLTNYTDEKKSEIILVEGKVSTSAIYNEKKTDNGSMHPGQMGVYSESTGKFYTEEVNVDKYISWRDGNLICRDDKMEEVVKRLSRWFNVEIVINDPEIKSYIYKANFRNENLLQVLNLLKMSAPIDFRITEPKPLQNGDFSKQKVFLMNKRA